MSHDATRSSSPGYAGSPWAAGASIFAATMMVVAGGFQFFEGLVAVVNGNDFLLRTPNYVLRLSPEAWGWTHMVIGLAVAVTGGFIFTGNVVARSVGIALVSLSALANFLWIPYYPFWGIVVLALDVLVIWGLATSNLGDR